MNDCIFCKDTGVCKFCKGTGKSGLLDCIHCDGSGVCHFCHGRSAGRVRKQQPRMKVKKKQSTWSSFMDDEEDEIEEDEEFQQHDFTKMSVDEIEGAGKIQKRDFTKMSVDEIMEYFMKGMSGGKFMKKFVGAEIRQVSKYGTGVSKIAPELWNKLLTGSIKEQIACAEIIGYMGEEAGGMFNQVAMLLSHKNSLVRESAINALGNLKKLATAVEEKIVEANNRETDKKLKKKISKILNKLGKVSSDEKDLILEEENEKRLLLEDIKEIEQNSKNIDTSKLGQGTNDFAQFKNVFFMSHALPDFPWVEKAINTISSWPGCYCWTCERDISPGEDWLTEIYNGLDACNWYVLFWSDKAENSKWTKEEMREAKTRNVASGNPKVSIVNLGKDQWPRLLSRHQGAVVTSDEELAKWLENLKSQVSL